MTTLLEVKGLGVLCGHIAIVKGIDLTLKTGEVTSLVGTNGADESTTLLAPSSLIPKSQGNVRGQILFEGEDVIQQSAHKRVKRGVVQVAEGRVTLTTMTACENLELGVCTRNARKDRGQAASDLERVSYPLLYLEGRIDGLVGNLSGGEQQTLVIGWALMARPRVLLLGELSMGLAPIIVQETFRILRTVNAEGLTIFLVEQNVHQAPEIAQHGCVSEAGEIVLADSGRNLLGNPRVFEACLGG